MTTGAERATARSRTARTARKAVKRAGEAVTPRAGAKRAVMSVVTALPNYLRLLYGLMRDARVSGLDKMLVVGAIVYILAPIDFIPDWIPFLGEVDDVFLLMTALERLMQNAGRRVVLAHWPGNPAELSTARLGQILSAAAFFLPGRMQRQLRSRALKGARSIPKGLRSLMGR